MGDTVKWCQYCGLHILPRKGGGGVWMHTQTWDESCQITVEGVDRPLATPKV